MTAITRVRDKKRTQLKEPMDIVITSGGGAPADSTLWRVLDSISAALPVLKEDGTIIVSAKMEDGYGPAPLEQILMACRTPAGFEKRFSSGTNFVPGQWIVQRLYDILGAHEVICHTGDTLDDDALWEAGLTPAHDIQEAVEVAMQGHGQRCKICALLDGPFSLPLFGAE